MKDCIACSTQARAGEEDEGPVAAWWEEWEEQEGPPRKRKHPTSKPSAEDAQQDQGLASLTVEVRRPLFLVHITLDRKAHV